MLLSVQAVGPKVALAVLSSARPRELVAALAGGDAARLQAVPGIGRRTAERIIVELREKVIAEDSIAEVRTPILARRSGAGAADPRALARAGLLELGYRPEEAEELLREAAGDSAEELIGEALRSARGSGAPL
jgi:Holliday junction DNA helicase RuvA